MSKLTVDPENYVMKDTNGHPITIIGKVDDTSVYLPGRSASEPPLLLISNKLQGDEILVSWESGMTWGYINFGPGPVQVDTCPT